MKTITALPALAALAILTGCEVSTPTLLSLESPAGESETSTAAGLTGAWECGDEVTLIHAQKDKPGQFDALYLGGDKPLGFEARLFEAGDALLMDVSPADDGDFRIPGHAIARIWLEGGELRWAFLDSDWLKESVSKYLASYETGGKMLLLATGPAVRAALVKFGGDDRAYGKIVSWKRLQ